MLERIETNEQKLDKIILAIKELENALNTFENVKEDIIAVNMYYGSKEWFEDKEKFEKGKIERVKAGVLSEDAVWNTNEEIAELIGRMKNININFKSSN